MNTPTQPTTRQTAHVHTYQVTLIAGTHPLMLRFLACRACAEVVSAGRATYTLRAYTAWAAHELETLLQCCSAVRTYCRVS
jgi:hypothetical protein